MTGPPFHDDATRSVLPPDAVDLPLAEKLAFLRQPGAYAEATAQVEVRETHMSWVFLTASHAYKLKKPVRYSYLDYSTLERRRSMCEQEILLNRRLADWVYLGIAVLVRDHAGRLALRTADAPVDGIAVEWLVQMRRLPDAQMLDNAIRQDTVQHADAARTASHLAAFFSSAPPVAATTHDFVGRLRRAIAENAAGIAAAGVEGLQPGTVADRLAAFLDRQHDLLERRVAGGKFIEGHGDLRPEHVYLGRPPAIIDCIEFSRELRLIDPLEELAFLWMECIRLGAGTWGELFLKIYLRESQDRAPEALMLFYMSLRACLRARLALGHLADAADAAHWRAKAREYLEIARRFADGL